MLVNSPPAAGVRPRRVLVFGGAGVFGARLTSAILNTTPWHVLVAGRDEARLAATVATLPAGRATAVTLDARQATVEALRAAQVFAVVDAAGPFQGAEPVLARVAIAAGIPIIDLADARDFVAGYGALDAAAKAAGVTALTGASSTPALSNAVLDTLTAGWSRVDRVEIAISPGNRAPRGLSVVRAILSYAGRPVRVHVAGEWESHPGWGLTVRRRFPGLGWRFLSLAETPDLDIVPARLAVRHTALFRAGLELPVLHLGLWLAALPVRWGLLRSLVPLARPFRAVAALLERFGSDRGGMMVEARGTDASGRSVCAVWSLVAEAGDGPSIPVLPALAALRLLAEGALPAGAGACVGVLPLAAIEAEFSRYRITTERREEHAGPALYERVLGEAFARLPGPVRRLHQPGWGLLARGMARVEGPEGPLAWLAARVFGLPPAVESVPVTVEIAPEPGEEDGRERWTRRFGTRRFFSVLSRSPTQGHVFERFGPFRFELALLAGEAGVVGMPPRRWFLGSVPLPRVLGPVSVAREYVDEQGRFCFDVEMRLPLGLGRVVRYRGWLDVV